MEKSQESASETEAQCGGGLRLKGEGGIVELQLLQCFPQIPVVGAVRRIDAGEHHGVYLPVAGESLITGGGSQCHRVAHLGIPY